MATIESAVRAMLTSSTALNAIPDARITHGFRLQDSALPAITFELAQDEYLTLGAGPLRSVSVELRVIDTTTKDAADLVASVQTAVRTGTFDTIVFQAVDFKGHAVENPAVTDGDEAEPAQVMVMFDIYY